MAVEEEAAAAAAAVADGAREKGEGKERGAEAGHADVRGIDEGLLVGLGLVGPLCFCVGVRVCLRDLILQSK